MMVSARDQIPARIRNVNEGAAIADVELVASIFPGSGFGGEFGAAVGAVCDS
jgi:hypothetical protein